MALVAINRYWFFLLNIFNKYIDNLSNRKQQFSIKKQDLQFYAIYANTIIKNGNVFTKKIKNRYF